MPSSFPKPDTETEQPQVGDRIGRYKLARRIHDGRVGPLWVLQFRHERKSTLALGRSFSLDSLADEDDREHLTESAWDAMDVEDEGVVHAGDVVFEGSQLLTVYDYVEGQPLGLLEDIRREQGATLPCEIAMRILTDVLSGLSAVHATAADLESGAGFGGVSSDSILVGSDGRTRLLDAFVAGPARRLLKRQRGASVPPEVASGAEANASSDIYAMGLLLCDLLLPQVRSGDSPLQTRNIKADIAKMRRRGDIDPKLISATEKALQKDPKQRFQSVSEMKKYVGSLGLKVAEPEELSSYLEHLAGDHLRDQRQVTDNSTVARIADLLFGKLGTDGDAGELPKTQLKAAGPQAQVSRQKEKSSPSNKNEPRIKLSSAAKATYDKDKKDVRPAKKDVLPSNKASLTKPKEVQPNKKVNLPGLPNLPSLSKGSSASKQDRLSNTKSSSLSSPKVSLPSKQDSPRTRDVPAAARKPSGPSKPEGLAAQKVGPPSKHDSPRTKEVPANRKLSAPSKPQSLVAPKDGLPNKQDKLGQRKKSKFQKTQLGLAPAGHGDTDPPNSDETTQIWSRKAADEAQRRAEVQKPAVVQQPAVEKTQAHRVEPVGSIHPKGQNPRMPGAPGGTLLGLPPVTPEAAHLELAQSHEEESQAILTESAPANTNATDVTPVDSIQPDEELEASVVESEPKPGELTKTPFESSEPPTRRLTGDELQAAMPQAQERAAHEDETPPPRVTPAHHSWSAEQAYPQQPTPPGGLAALKSMGPFASFAAGCVVMLALFGGVTLVRSMLADSAATAPVAAPTGTLVQPVPQAVPTPVATAAQTAPAAPAQPAQAPTAAPLASSTAAQVTEALPAAAGSTTADPAATANPTAAPEAPSAAPSVGSATAAAEAPSVNPVTAAPKARPKAKRRIKKRPRKKFVPTEL